MQKNKNNRGNQVSRSGSACQKARSRRSRVRPSILTLPLNLGRLETKFQSNALSTVAPSISTAATILDLCSLISGGDGVSNRVGRQIKVHEVRLSGTLIQGVVDGIADDRYNVVRMVVLTAEATTNPTISIDSVLTPSTIRYLEKVYMDKVVALYAPAPDSTGYLPCARRVEFVCPINRKFNFYTTSGSPTVTLEIHFVSDSSAIPNPGFVQGAVVTVFSDE